MTNFLLFFLLLLGTLNLDILSFQEVLCVASYPMPLFELYSWSFYNSTGRSDNIPIMKIASRKMSYCLCSVSCQNLLRAQFTRFLITGLILWNLKQNICRNLHSSAAGFFDSAMKLSLLPSFFSAVIFVR